jgi:hypothetical protein
MLHNCRSASKNNNFVENKFHLHIRSMQQVQHSQYNHPAHLACPSLRLSRNVAKLNVQCVAIPRGKENCAISKHSLCATDLITPPRNHTPPPRHKHYRYLRRLGDVNQYHCLFESQTNYTYVTNVVPIHVRKAYKGRTGTDLLILNLGIRWSWLVGPYRSPTTLLRERTPVPI